VGAGALAGAGAGLGGAGSGGWREAESSRSAAAVRCSSCGRDTSRARMAVDKVIFVTGMNPVSSSRLVYATRPSAAGPPCRPDQAGFSTDGSIVETVRAGGQVDLRDVATRKYLTTVTDRAVTNDPYGAFVGPGGSEVAIIGDDASHQVSLWKTPLGSPKPAGA
jgi:hypothetical protein